MRKKWAALAVALCMLLSGCGGTGAASSAPESAPAPAEASVQNEASATETDTPKAEDSQAAAETGSMTPEELGQWAWAQMEAYDEASYAVDYDMDMAITVDIDGESTTQKASGRVKEIDSDTDGNISYQSMQMNGAVTETWYGGGYVYLSDSDGKYKAPISDEDDLEEQNSADDLLELDAGSFGTLTAEQTDTGYTVTFGDPSLDTWMAFSDMLSGVDEGVNCTAFTLDGTVEMDENGALRKLDMELSVQFDLLGMTLSETATISQTINCYDGDVTIHVPEDDADFREVSDINLPTAFINGFNTLLSQYGVSYQSQLNIDITDGTDGEAFVETNLINYVYDEDNGLSMTWDITQTLNGETIGETNDSYANGEGVQVIDGEENSYTYDDTSTMTDIQNTVAFYSDCFAYGSDYQLEQDGDYQKLTMTLDSEYVEAVAAAYLDALDAELDMDEASEIVSEGTISFWYDLSGMLVMQLYQGTSTMTYTGAELTISVTDNGAVLAVNDGVTVNAGA
jgi:hypothetical protein